MQPLRKLLIGSLLVVAFGSAQAQPVPQDSTPPDNSGVELSGSAGVQAKLSPAEMQSQADSLRNKMEEVQSHLTELQAQARASKDIIKLNCVNDKLLQVKQLLNIADTAKSRLNDASAKGDEGDRYHQYTMITVSAEKVSALKDEADACIGKELVFRGASNVEVVRPAIFDDPTKMDPFSLGGFQLERPTYATPYL